VQIKINGTIIFVVKSHQWNKLAFLATLHNFSHTPRKMCVFANTFVRRARREIRQLEFCASWHGPDCEFSPNDVTPRRVSLMIHLTYARTRKRRAAHWWWPGQQTNEQLICMRNVTSEETIIVTR